MPQLKGSASHIRPQELPHSVIARLRRAVAIRVPDLFASGGPISRPVRKWAKETAGGKIPISFPRTLYLKRRKG